MRDKLVLWFQENYTELFDLMQKTDHNVSSENTNLYHAEGTVWTHTMMVMTVINENKNLLSKYKDVLLIVGLLHDIGKPLAFEQVLKDDKLRNRFKGHEGISTFMAVSIIDHMIKDKLIDESYKELIIRLISLHGTNTNQYPKGLEDRYLLEKFRYADKNGAIRNVDENIYEQYDERKFSTNHDKNSDKTGTILVGLPASGKSTYIDDYNFKNVISRDQEMYNFLFIEKKFAKTYLNSSYNQVYKTIHSDEILLKGFNSHFDSRVKQLAKENHVTVDMTMLSVSSRRKMMNQLGKRNYECIVFLPSIERINSRNKIREKEGKYISEDVYMNMMKSFVMPHEIEGFSKVRYVFN